jgi:hypothetical protein
VPRSDHYIITGGRGDHGLANPSSEALTPLEGSASRRTLWGLGDQVVSSATNFGVTLVAARALSARDFGVFAILITIYVLTNGVIRGLVSEPLLVEVSGAERSVWRPAAARAIVGASLLGVACGCVLLVGAALASSSDRGAIVALGLTFPLLTIQDTARFAALAKGEPKVALLSDGVWAVVLFSALVVLSGTERLDLEALMVAWGGAGAAAGLVAVALLRVTKAIRQQRVAFPKERGTGMRFAADYVISQGASLVTVIVLGSVAGPAQAGVFRLAQLVFGPLVVLMSATRLAIIPELVRIAGYSADIFRLRVVQVSAVLTASAVVWGLAAYLAPVGLGERLLGPDWPASQPLTLGLTIAVAAGAAETGLLSGIRVLQDAGGALRARAIVGAVTFLAAVVGALLDGATGAVFGLAATAPIGFALWSLQFRSSLARARSLALASIART